MKFGTKLDEYITSNFRYRPIFKIAHNGHGGHICAAITEKQLLLDIMGTKQDICLIKGSDPILSGSGYPLKAKKVMYIFKIAHNGHDGHIWAAITEKQYLFDILGTKQDICLIKVSNPVVPKLGGTPP